MKGKSGPNIKQINYEVFVIILTILSWVNIALLLIIDDPDARSVVIKTEQYLTVFFLLDFVYRLKIADSRSEYLKKYGWLDLLGSFPLLRWLRAYRVYKTLQFVTKIHGRRVFSAFFANRAETAALSVILAVILLFEFASIFILQAEADSPNANIETAGDAVWWVLVTVATVGYGDKYPVTQDGRFIAVFVIVAGVGLFGILSGFLTRNFLGDAPNKETTDTPHDLDAQMAQILAELQAIKDQQVETHIGQETANEEIRQRLKTVEELLESKREEQ